MVRQFRPESDSPAPMLDGSQPLPHRDLMPLASMVTGPHLHIARHRQTYVSIILRQKFKNGRESTLTPFLETSFFLVMFLKSIILASLLRFETVNSLMFWQGVLIWPVVNSDCILAEALGSLKRFAKSSQSGRVLSRAVHGLLPSASLQGLPLPASLVLVLCCC